MRFEVDVVAQARLRCERFEQGRHTALALVVKIGPMNKMLPADALPATSSISSAHWARQSERCRIATVLFSAAIGRMLPVQIMRYHPT